MEVCHIDEKPLHLLLVRTAESFGVDLEEDLALQVTLLVRDADRRLNHLIARKAELIQHGVTQDVCALRLLTKVLGGDVCLTERLFSSYEGFFTRAGWLVDILHDIEREIINISEEEAEEFQIDISKLRGCRTWEEVRRVSGFMEWYREEIESFCTRWVYIRREIEDNMKVLFPPFLARNIIQQMIIKRMEREARRLYALYVGEPRFG